MNPSEIANRINELTGSWFPGGSATSQDLREARLRLADGLFSNTASQATRSPVSFRSRPISASQPEADAVAALATSTATVMPHLRNGADVDPAASAFVAGMRVDKTLGPFIDSFGVSHWVDLIPLPHRIPVSSASKGVLGFLVTNTPSPQLGPGSIWVSVDSLSVPHDNEGTVGLSFSAGKMLPSGPVSMSASGIKIGLGGKLTLELTVAVPTPAPGPSGLGPDVQQMSLNLPAHVTIEFTEGGVAFSAFEDSSATVYGTKFTLRGHSKKPHVVSLGLNYVLFPCNASIAEFTFGDVSSTDIVPSGKATVIEAGWGLQITTAPPPQLGAASSAGSLILSLGSGVSLRFGNLTVPASLSAAKLALSPSSITISGVNGSREIVDRLMLWNPAPPRPLVAPVLAQHSSEIDATIPRGATLFASVTRQNELTIAFGRARANVDRPLSADGTRLPIAFSSALIAFVNAETKSVVVLMSQPDLSGVGFKRSAAIALENGILRVGPATTGVLYASFSGTRLVGVLEFTFENVTIFPILPDPYASANVAFLPFSGTVTALVTWTVDPGAALRFGIVQPIATTANVEGAKTGYSFVGGSTLLDLSTNADQIGVSFAGTRRAPNAIAFDGIALAAPQEFLSVYALPGISWEPVVDQDQDDWLDAPSPDDGPPIELRVKTANLVRVEPSDVLSAFAQAQGKADLLGRFTLPFGLIATLQMAATDPPEQRPALSFVPGIYTSSGLAAARQLSIRAQSVIHVGDPALPGNTTTGSPLPVPLNSAIYGVLTLGNDPLGAAQFFDQEFSVRGVYPQIPVTRIDISGYGTSMFSDWKNLDLKTVGVVRTRFDVLVGRTAFELVQIATIIIPWCIRITRTVIFDRFDSGLVVRHDTGWKAIGVGKFESLAADQKLLGAVERLQNVHNIVVGTGASFKFASPDVPEQIPPSEPSPPIPPLRIVEFIPVTFDADVVMSPSVTAISHGNASPLVAGTQIQGYAQLTVGPAASALEILKAIQQLPNGVAGSIGCIMNVGSVPDQINPRFTLNASSILAKATKSKVSGKGYPALAVAVTGTPRLPRDGAWSITKRAQGDTQPSSVDPTFPIPLIFGSNNDRKFQWRLLGPEDALSANSPDTVFGLMQGTGTSKTLFENPVIDSGGKSLLLDPSRGVPPVRLADLGSLLGAAGIFPNLANVLRIPTSVSDALQLVQDGFQKTFTWKLSKNNDNVTALDDQKLLDLGVVSMVLQYQNAKASRLASATFIVDAAPPAGQPRWSLEIRDLAAAVFVAGFGTDALLTIHGAFKASETSKAGFTDIEIDYGNALELITNVLQGIRDLVTAIGGSVDLDVGFSGNKLTIREGFALPTLPLGLGELQHIGIDLGLTIEIPSSAEFTVGLASKEDPFTWIVDPLAGNGAIVLGTSGGEMGVFIEAGIGAALEINVAIASGGASIILDFSFQLRPPDIVLGVALTGNANVNVLDGLTSVSLTLTASISVDLVGLPPSQADFTGAVAVGIHISIAWVVSVDFDGSWSFSESVRLHLP